MLKRLLSANEREIILDEMDPKLGRRFIINDMFIKLDKCEVKILVDAEKINSQHMGSYNQVKAYIVIEDPSKVYSPIQVTGHVAYGNWPKLKGIPGPQIDLVEHLDKLLPVNGRAIGLLTYQNGIQNKPEDFADMGRAIHSNLRQGMEMPLCIGLYNKPSGIAHDLYRLNDEWFCNPDSLMALRQLIVTFANRLPGINPLLMWVHIAHSEAGLIASEVLTSSRYPFDCKVKNFLINQVITEVYGGVGVVPSSAVASARNTYSIDDITIRYIKKYLDRPPHSRFDQAGQELAEPDLLELSGKLAQHPMVSLNNAQNIYDTYKSEIKNENEMAYIQPGSHGSEHGYDIKIVESMVDRKYQKAYEGYDHNFGTLKSQKTDGLGATYQVALRDNLVDLRQRYGGIKRG